MNLSRKAFVEIAPMIPMMEVLKMARRSLSDALFRLAAAEQAFLHQEFLAPVISGGTVRVRIAGVVCTMAISPADFRGWGVFRADSTAAATFLRPPMLSERQRYLQLFPSVSLLLCERFTGEHGDTMWSARLAHRGDSRFANLGMVSVRLVEDAERFDTITARFDGGTFWFEDSDRRANLAKAAFLRKSLKDKLPPKELRRRGLTPDDRAAYAHCWKPTPQPKRAVVRDETEERLRSALAHAGGQLVSYREQADSYRVTYLVGNRQMVTSVDKTDLSVQVAGICLSGGDSNFDLSSLVGVLREGGGNTVAIGQSNNGMSEDSYWSMYGRR